MAVEARPTLVEIATDVVVLIIHFIAGMTGRKACELPRIRGVRVAFGTTKPAVFTPCNGEVGFVFGKVGW